MAPEAHVGGPLAQSVSEVGAAIEPFEWFAGEAERLFGDTIASRQGGRLLIEPEPVGICAAFTAWNFLVAHAEVPFGGVDHSGISREGGREAICDYQNVKLTHMMWS